MNAKRLKRRLIKALYKMNPHGEQIVLGKNFVPEWVYEKLIAEKKRIDMA